MFATRHCSTVVKNLGDGIRVRLYFAYDIDAPLTMMLTRRRQRGFSKGSKVDTQKSLSKR